MPDQRSITLFTCRLTPKSAGSLNEVKVTMDDMDWALLGELQADARLSFSELSRRVHLSPPAVAERVRRLEEAGIVTGYHAHVDLTKAGRHVMAMIRMSCYGPRCVLRDPAVAGWPEVLEIHRITGDACCMLKVATSSMEAFEQVIDRLGPYGQPSSTMVLSTPLGWRPVIEAPVIEAP
jgi:Lrp/AsnC family leucine-responsive transcriptional regulator